MVPNWLKVTDSCDINLNNALSVAVTGTQEIFNFKTS